LQLLPSPSFTLQLSEEAQPRSTVVQRVQRIRDLGSAVPLAIVYALVHLGLLPEELKDVLETRGNLLSHGVMTFEYLVRIIFPCILDSASPEY
jgi:hypothetical protein